MRRGSNVKGSIVYDVVLSFFLNSFFHRHIKKTGWILEKGNKSYGADLRAVRVLSCHKGKQTYKRSTEEKQFRDWVHISAYMSFLCHWLLQSDFSPLSLLLYYFRILGRCHHIKLNISRRFSRMVLLKTFNLYVNN